MLGFHFPPFPQHIHMYSSYFLQIWRSLGNGRYSSLFSQTHRLRLLVGTYELYITISPNIWHFILIRWSFLEFLLLGQGHKRPPTRHRFGQKWQPASMVVEENCALASLRKLGCIALVDVKVFPPYDFILEFRLMLGHSHGRWFTFSYRTLERILGVPMYE